MARDLGTTGGQLLVLIKEAEVDGKTQAALVSKARDVALTTAALVTNTRTIADKCKDQALKNQISAAAKQTAMVISTLVTCTILLAPRVNSLPCQEQLIEACKNVTSAVKKMVTVAQTASEDGAGGSRELGDKATAVTEALNSLIQQIKGVLHRDKGRLHYTCTLCGMYIS